MIRWLLRILGGLLALLVLSLAVFLAWNWTHVRAFPAILPGFTAKEMCSCRFVMRQDDAYCTAYVRQWLPISGMRVEEQARRFTVEALLTTRSARWLSPREGCRLE